MIFHKKETEKIKLVARPGPVLLVVEVSVASVDWEEGVGQGSPSTVERVPITMGFFSRIYVANQGNQNFFKAGRIKSSLGRIAGRQHPVEQICFSPCKNINSKK